MTSRVGCSTAHDAPGCAPSRAGAAVMVHDGALGQPHIAGASAVSTLGMHVAGRMAVEPRMPRWQTIGACSVHARLYKSPPVSRACKGDSGAGCGSSWPLSREPAALAAEIALWPGASGDPDLPQQDPGSAQPTGFASDLRTDAMAPCAFQHR